jgi:hypothetical protein
MPIKKLIGAIQLIEIILIRNFHRDKADRELLTGIAPMI